MANYIPFNSRWKAIPASTLKYQELQLEAHLVIHFQINWSWSAVLKTWTPWLPCKEKEVKWPWKVAVIKVGLYDHVVSIKALSFPLTYSIVSSEVFYTFAVTFFLSRTMSSWSGHLWIHNTFCFHIYFKKKPRLDVNSIILEELFFLIYYLTISAFLMECLAPSYLM